MAKTYSTDLTPAQIEFIQPLIPPAKPGGRPRKTDMIAVINSIFYVAKTGCQWAFLPHDFPPPSTVYTYFNQWRKDGTWQRMNERLRMQVRICEERHPSPSAGSCDSQSVKVGNPHCQGTNFDGGKLVKGHKRHILVDTLGLLIMVIVTAANISDQRGAKILFWKAKRLGASVGRLVRIWADGTYQGQAFMEWVMKRFRWILEVVKRSDDTHGFVVIPKRWIVERTFAWLNWNRRLSKNYEVLPTAAESFCYVAMIRLMLRRLENAT